MLPDFDRFILRLVAGRNRDPLGAMIKKRRDAGHSKRFATIQPLVVRRESVWSAAHSAAFLLGK